MMTKVSSSVAAQDRMPPIPRGQLSDAQKQAIAEFKDVRKADVSGPFTPLLRSPEVMNRARAMGDYLRWNSALPPRLSEFALGISGHYTLLAMVLNAARTPLPAGRQPALAPFPHYSPADATLVHEFTVLGTGDPVRWRACLSPACVSSCPPRIGRS